MSFLPNAPAQAPQQGLALLHVDGRSGFGRVRRMIMLARALRENEGVGILFALRGEQDMLPVMRTAGFAAEHVASHGAFLSLVAARAPDLLILDGSEGPSRAQLDAMRPSVPVMAVIEDFSDRRLACDFAYYPPLPSAMALGWAGARALPRIGWQWTAIGSSVKSAPGPRRARPTVLVMMDDAGDLILPVARALTPLAAAHRLRFVIGPGRARKAASAIAALNAQYETVEGALDLSTEYQGADLALCGFGVAAYELAAFGVPALYLEPDEPDAVGALVKAGMGLSLGPAAAVTPHTLLSAARALLADGRARARMRAGGLGALDGLGAARIAAELASAWRGKRQPPLAGHAARALG